MSATPPTNADKFFDLFASAARSAAAQIPKFGTAVAVELAGAAKSQLPSAIISAAEQVMLDSKVLKHEPYSPAVWYSLGLSVSNFIYTAGQASSAFAHSLDRTVGAAANIIEPFAKLGEDHPKELAAISGALSYATSQSALLISFGEHFAKAAGLPADDPKTLSKRVVYGASLQLVYPALSVLATVSAVAAIGVVAYLSTTPTTEPKGGKSPR